MIDTVIDFLDRQELAPGVYRTAVRLARLTETGAGYVRVSHTEMAALCESESENTVRGHLAKLAATGLFTYKRNHAVHIMWADAVICGGSIRAVVDQNDPTQITTNEAVICVGSIRAVGDHDEAENEKSDPPPRDSRGGGSNRAVGDHPIGRLGRMVGREIDDPTYLPGGSGGAGQKQSNSGPADDEERQRSFALLTDSEVGLDKSSAAVLAQRYRFEAIKAMVFRFVRDRDAGTVRSAAIITTRFSKSYAPGPVLRSDRESALWRRHCAEEGADVTGESPEEIRRRYMPPGYEGIILGCEDEREGYDERE
jgi:hypothetical protein